MSFDGDPSPYGSPLQKLWDAGTQAVSAKMSAAGSAISAAKDKVVDLAGSAASAVADAGATAARKAGAFGLVGTEAAAALGIYQTVKTAQTAYQVVTAPIKAANAVKTAFSNQRPPLTPCVTCAAKESAPVRAARIERRNQLIAQSQVSPDPKVRAAGQELKSDMHAVELASLSEDTYSQYDPKNTDKTPPSPWRAMTKDELIGQGLDPAVVEQSKAVIYKCPDDFPYDPKTVVAFRGTTGEREDIITDHDQALGLKTSHFKVTHQTSANVERSRTTGKRQECWKSW